MCYHAYQLDEAPPTREERLLEMRAVREHHRTLADEANWGLPGARDRFYAHLRLHHQTAARLKAGRAK